MCPAFFFRHNFFKHFNEGSGLFWLNRLGNTHLDPFFEGSCRDSHLQWGGDGRDLDVATLSVSHLEPQKCCLLDSTPVRNLWDNQPAFFWMGSLWGWIPTESWIGSAAEGELIQGWEENLEKCCELRLNVTECQLCPQLLQPSGCLWGQHFYCCVPQCCMPQAKSFSPAMGSLSLSPAVFLTPTEGESTAEWSKVLEAGVK